MTKECGGEWEEAFQVYCCLLMFIFCDCLRVGMKGLKYIFYFINMLVVGVDTLFIVVHICLGGVLILDICDTFFN